MSEAVKLSSSRAKFVEQVAKCPAVCPTCGCERWNYATWFRNGGWKIMFRCGHFFCSEEPEVSRG